ncbi:MAG: hypothetical protein LBQ50_06300 [Planctomycetaceae bacterium]|jgi:hypothetical protein|nr:hypothetical protein [Planctomycetaceae bacterium]
MGLDNVVAARLLKKCMLKDGGYNEGLAPETIDVAPEMIDSFCTLASANNLTRRGQALVANVTCVAEP